MNKNILKKIIIIILIAALSESGYLLLKEYNKRKKEESNKTQVQSLTPDIKGLESCPNPLDSKLIDSLYWWNENYPYYVKISITEQENFDSNKWVSITFNHQSLVEAGKSLNSGQDIRLIAKFNDNQFKEIPFNIINPNTFGTKIEFENYKDQEILMYYGDLNAVAVNLQQNYTLNETSSYGYNLSQEIVYPIHIELNHKWALLGLDDDTLDINVTLAEGLDINYPAVNYEILDTDYSSAVIDDNGKYQTEVYIKDLTPGEYKIQATLTDECITVKSPKLTFYVSYPLFVAWTMDWEGYEIDGNYLNKISNISSKYDIPITQFFNPRIYYTNSIKQENIDYMTNWVKDRITNGSDEIALHLHMWKDMIRACGVTPKDKPQWDVMTNGYDVLFSTYNYNESNTIIKCALDKMNEKGFTGINAFRAGGWEISIDNMMALESNGIKIDSSGRTKHNLGTQLISSTWHLDATTRPYHPSKADINITDANHMNLWEFPNNGAESYLYTYEQMKERFDKNYTSKYLSTPQVVTFLSHPHWFNIDEPKIDALFNYISLYNYEKDRGPVMFITLDEALKYWDTNNIE